MAFIEMDFASGGGSRNIDFANPENVKGSTTYNTQFKVTFASKPDLAIVYWLRNSTALGWQFVVDLVNQKGYAQYVRNSTTAVVDYYELSSSDITFTDTGFILPILRDMSDSSSAGVYNALGYKYV